MVISLEGKRILLVDDQRFVRTIVKGILKQLGCTDVDMAEDGTQAITRLSEDTYHAAICDIKMRPMNGLQLVKSIRSDLTDARFDMPIIMLTGHPEERFVKAAMELHVNAFCIKPVTAATLRHKITHAISNPMQIEQPVSSNSAVIDDANSIPGGAPAPKETYVRRSAAQIEATKRAAAKRIKQCPVTALKPGQILADQIQDKNGKTLIRRGVTLTDDTISQIMQICTSLGRRTIPIYE